MLFRYIIYNIISMFTCYLHDPSYICMGLYYYIIYIALFIYCLPYIVKCMENNFRKVYNDLHQQHMHIHVLLHLICC